MSAPEGPEIGQPRSSRALNTPNPSILTPFPARYVNTHA